MSAHLILRGHIEQSFYRRNQVQLFSPPIILMATNFTYTELRSQSQHYNVVQCYVVKCSIIIVITKYSDVSYANHIFDMRILLTFELLIKIYGFSTVVYMQMT